MRGIRRRKGGRNFFIVAASDIERGTGGGVTVVSRDERTHVGGREPRRERCGASRRANASREHATLVTRRGRVGWRRANVAHVPAGKPRRDRCSRARLFFAVRACNERDAAEGEARRSRCTTPLARAGAAARPLRATHGCFLRCKRATGVTRRGWAGGARRIERRRARIALTVRRSVMLREGWAVGATQIEVRLRRLQVMGDGRRTLGRCFVAAWRGLPLLSMRFQVMPRGFAIVAGMRETTPGMLKMVPGSSPAMFRRDFSTPRRLR